MTVIEFNLQIIGFRNGLNRFAYSLVNNRDDALDLVQETYLKAVAYREKLSDYSNLKVWILTIMKNIFINNYHRKTKGRNIIEEKKALAKSFDSGFDTTSSFYTKNEINKVVESLNNELKIPFTMYTDGFKYREIADKLGINIGTVKSRIHTARQKLTELLKDFQ